MGGYQGREGEALVPPLPDPSELTAGERRELVAKALVRAEELRRQKRHKEAIDLLVDLLRYGEEKAMIYFRLGNVYFDAGDLARAEYAYQRAIQEDPHHASAHHNLGVVYRKQGRIAESVKMLKKARRLEIRYPKKVELTPEQKKAILRLAWPMMVVPVALIALFFLIAWLVGRLSGR
ncbi:tetratricopeptide repeat protein [Candidatus Bipolaricaulota bacterium]|nr:tetratricopeptide repeat protein [Candidatus Bipolaricaulota bacterium]